MSLGIIDYLKSLIPHVETSKILEDLRMTEEELQETVLPAFSQAKDFFSSQKFASGSNQSLDRELSGQLKNTGMGKSPTFLDAYYAGLVRMTNNIKALTKLVNQEMGRDVVTEGASSKKIVLMRAAERISYVSRKSLDLLNLIYVNEAIEVGADAREVSMSKAEVAKAEESVPNLGRLLNMYGVDTHAFEKLVNEMPDLVLSSAGTEDLEATYNDQELDPFDAPLAKGFVGNPIYHVRMAIAEWQVQRYKAAQEKKKVLELRLLHLRVAAERGGTNPSIERQIAYTQGRVATLDRYLTSTEQELGVAA
jgi:hypothetical protein